MIRAILLLAGLFVGQIMGLQAQCPTTTYALCSGETYILTAQSGLTNIQWEIDNGSGFTSVVGANAPTYVVMGAGKYRYTAKDTSNCDIVLCCPFEITVGTNCPPACSTTTYPLCSGDSYTLTAQSGLTNIQWQVDNGAGFTNISGATSAGYIASAVGKYRYTAKDGSGCDMVLCCPFELVTGTNCPAPCPTTPYPICSGESYTLTAQSGLTNIKWQINTGGGFSDIPSATGSTYVASTVGKYRYMATDVSGCSISLCCPFELVAGNCPAPCPTTVYEMCAGESYRITAQAGLTDVQWQVDNGAGFTNISGATHSFYDATASGKYKYTAKDAGGCAIELCCPFNISVYSVPAPPAVTSPQMNICPNQTVNLTFFSSALPNNLTYEWHISNSQTSALVATPSAVTAGMYYLFAKNSSNCYSTATGVAVQIQICCPSKPICLPVTVMRVN